MHKVPEINIAGEFVLLVKDLSAIFHPGSIAGK